MKKIEKNWNVVDTVIFSIEKQIYAIIESLRSNRDTIDPEEMILAATEHLQNENEELKKYRIPEKIIIVEHGQYTCPNCRKEVHHELLKKYKIKYCPECGQRFLTQKIS